MDGTAPFDGFQALDEATFAPTGRALTDLDHGEQALLDLVFRLGQQRERARGRGLECTHQWHRDGHAHRHGRTYLDGHCQLCGVCVSLPED